MSTRKLTAADKAAIFEMAKGWGKIIARQAYGESGPGTDVDLTAMEEIAVLASQGLTAGTLEVMTRKQAAGQGQEADCPSCGQRCPLRTEPQPIVVRGGKFTLQAPYAHCPRCRRDFFPSAPLAAAGQSRL